LSQARQQLPIQGPGGYPVPIAEILTEARSSQIVELLSRVNQLTEAGLLQSAMEEAYYTLHFAPTYLPLHAYMGDLLLKQNRLPEAVAKLVVVARTYSIRGDYLRAIDLYRQVIKLAPLDVEAHSLLINQLEAIGQVNEAIQAYLDLAEVHYDLADMNGVRNAFFEALRLVQERGADRSWRVKILYRMADHDLQRLDLRQALCTFEQIRMLEPDDEKARIKLAEINFRLGQESLALSEVDNYVAYLGSKGQKEKAASFLQSLIQENPGLPSLLRRLADVYIQLGRISDAVSQLDAVGEANLQAGDRAGAVGAVEAILKLKPVNAAAYQQLLGQLRGS
jgi:tetratricopeptide (TPR) repeat protein